MTIYSEPRQRLIDWVRQQLIGPSDSDDTDIFGVLPTERYPCGALYPTTRWGDGLDPAGDVIEEVDNLSGAAGESTAEPAVVRRYVPPSSLGFSFYIIGADIRLQVLCRAVAYRSERDKTDRYTNRWKRQQLVAAYGDDEEFENLTCPGEECRQSFHKLTDSARVDVQWRRFADGWIVTVSLCNALELTDVDSGREYVEQRSRSTLFEAGLRCVVDAGDVGLYPRVDRSLLDEEEQEMELQYRNRHIYAIGHGCAANWEVRDNKVIEIRSETMPAVEVPQMTADTGGGREPALSLSRLTEVNSDFSSVAAALETFIEEYASWVLKQEADLAVLPSDDLPAASRLVQRMSSAVSRMRTGLQLLSDSALVREAFSIANQSMLDQMRQQGVVQGKSMPDDAYRWRPFQLAFLLTALESTVNDNSKFRETVDLIWFPTGGGKTEAYLGLLAFQIALRRLAHPDTGGGTAVLMRYTLRLLTRDQFLRATRLICALELIRRARDDLGAEPITIGLWVGEDTSPNTFARAMELLSKASVAGEVPELVLGDCPWCTQKFKTPLNYISSAKEFHFRCHNPSCAFGASATGALPCNIVDEALYANPPTMLVGTVDKFARLTWESRASAFFGGSLHRPPELIIQDELHLIASALGSVAGVYESAIDTVLQLRGVYPKYVASTATIRMAEQQVKRLYGREVAVFPPSGLNCDDAYFARTVPLSQRSGRVYVGYLAPMLNRQQCLAPLAAALLLAPQVLFENDQQELELLDAWWTQVVYHGSLKGVGNSHTAFASDVRDFMQLLLANIHSHEVNDKHVRTTTRVAQLTSLQTAAQNSEIFSRLSRARSEIGCLDAVLATNMISVGLDVARLALMIINGQPLTTAEYIQASSRVGRSAAPGLVFANYYREQARSLSHYESFRPYHEAFYRFVEPTSVTPYTYQARQRALPAALVIVVRHSGLGLLDNTAAGKFDPNDAKVAKAILQFKRRCQFSASEQHQQVCEHIDSLVAEWRDEARRCSMSRRQLDYHVADKDNSRDRLLYNHDDRIRGLWATLQSLRNVENSALLNSDYA